MRPVKNREYSLNLVVLVLVVVVLVVLLFSGGSS